jgi:hypothetical protein
LKNHITFEANNLNLWGCLWPFEAQNAWN